jgi:hypothetical protein
MRIGLMTALRKAFPQVDSIMFRSEFRNRARQVHRGNLEELHWKAALKLLGGKLAESNTLSVASVSAESSARSCSN